MLHVTIHEGRNLAAKDRRFLRQNSSDPYVKVKLHRHEVYRTRVVKASLNPVWKGEHCTVVVQDAETEVLELICMDEDLVGGCVACPNSELILFSHVQIGADDLIGKMVFTLSNSDLLSKEPRWSVYFLLLRACGSPD